MMKKYSVFSFVTVVIIITLLTGFIDSVAYGTVYNHRDGSSGDWYDGDEWRYGVPQSNHAVYINSRTVSFSSGSAVVQSISLSGSSVFQHSNGTMNSGSLTVGSSSGTSLAVYELSGTAELNSYNETICDDARGEILQTGGTNNIENWLYMSGYQNNSAKYTLKGGTLNAKRIWGPYTPNTFTYDGGQLNITDGITVGSFRLGYEAGSNVSYEITDSCSISVDDDETLGYYGSGTIEHTSGSHSVDRYFILGKQGTGRYVHSGGTAELGQMVLGDGYSSQGIYELKENGTVNASSLKVGGYGEGEFTQTGGILQVNYDLIIGSGSGGDGGLYTISGGDMTARDLTIGYHCQGELAITDADASITIQNDFSLGWYGKLTAVAGSEILMQHGNWMINNTNPAINSDLANVDLLYRVGSIEVSGRDLGAVEEGFIDNFALGSLILEGTSSVKLMDNYDNTEEWVGEEALYLNILIVPNGGVLDLDGYNLYCREAYIDSGANILSIENLHIIPEPGSIALLTFGVLLMRKIKSQN